MEINHHKLTMLIYFILSSEINAYQKQIIYFHCIFWITSDISIHLMQFTSELQMPITFLFVNKNIKCVYAFS